MEEILQSISTVGFPIVMSLLLLWRMREQDDKHAEEMKSVTEALNKNTLAIEKLCGHMEEEKK